MQVAQQYCIRHWGLKPARCPITTENRGYYCPALYYRSLDVVFYIMNKLNTSYITIMYTICTLIVIHLYIIYPQKTNNCVGYQ